MRKDGGQAIGPRIRASDGFCPPCGLGYLYERVIAVDDTPAEPPRRGIIHGIFRWMEQPI